MERLDRAINNTKAALLSRMNAHGHWEGRLSSSALSTATAIVALAQVDATAHRAALEAGTAWLVQHQNQDGGWGDTSISKSNLSTTLLVWSALGLMGQLGLAVTPSAIERVEVWLKRAVGSLAPDKIAEAVVKRYGKDRTFSVPILMLAAICGRLGKHGWERVLPLPFELALMPRAWFGRIGLPVVSYALPALIAIGFARFHHAPPSALSPMGWMRRFAWPRVRSLLASLQPSSGGYLEATPLTSFVTMALASTDAERGHPCIAPAVAFLLKSMREDGSWPIDTNLATWGTTLAVKALGHDLDKEQRQRIKTWLLGQQYREVHPFTNAAPGGWAWTDLPGGVPDADDTSGALLALWDLCEDDAERRELLPQVTAGILWLVGLQNRDGGMPTFCRGWGTLPFDRSTPEITAHALWAMMRWRPLLDAAMQGEVDASREGALNYLKAKAEAFARIEAKRTFREAPKGMIPAPRRLRHWEPLWFGNENAPDEANPVYGTAQVLAGLLGAGEAVTSELVQRAGIFLFTDQEWTGGWGGARGVEPSIEETAVSLAAVAPVEGQVKVVMQKLPVKRATEWLLGATQEGTSFPSAPIGLYFARLWYHEELYPILWTLTALKAARRVLAPAAEPEG